jgi:cytochrome P450 family 9
MRSTLSPAFTGSKMRQMFEFVRNVGQQTAKTMQEDIKAGKDSAMEFKALAMRFSVDVIASCSFGIEINSFENTENEFYKIAETITNLNNFVQTLKFVGYQISSKLMKILGIEFFDSSISRFFREATLETMKVREEKGIVRQDMINLLMEARKGKLVNNKNDEKVVDGFATVEEHNLGKANVKQTWTDEELIAQCLIFFFAGFDTVGIVLKQRLLQQKRCESGFL